MPFEWVRQMGSRRRWGCVGYDYAYALVSQPLTLHQIVSTANQLVEKQLVRLCPLDAAGPRACASTKKAASRKPTITSTPWACGETSAVFRCVSDFVLQQIQLLIKR